MVNLWANQIHAATLGWVTIFFRGIDQHDKATLLKMTFVVNYTESCNPGHKSAI